MMKMINAVDKTFSVAEFALVAVLAIGALGLGVSHVVSRYVFNTGASWSESIFVVMTIAAMLFAGSRAVRDDGHVRVDVIPLLLPTRPRRVLRMSTHVISFLLCGFYCYCGYLYVNFVARMGTISPDTRLPDWVVYLLVPITMGMFAIRYLILIIRELNGENTEAKGIHAGDTSAIEGRV